MYKVVYEIELEGETPLDAAKNALNWLKDDNSMKPLFYIQKSDDNSGQPLYSVDLNEEDEDAVLEVPVETYTPLITK